MKFEIKIYKSLKRFKRSEKKRIIDINLIKNRLNNFLTNLIKLTPIILFHCDKRFPSLSKFQTFTYVSEQLDNLFMTEETIYQFLMNNI